MLGTRIPCRLAIACVVGLAFLVATPAAFAAVIDGTGHPMGYWALYEQAMKPYAAYTVVEEPYAPYTAGPVVREVNPYAPYTVTGEPYAPYTAGPVVPEAKPRPYGGRSDR